METLTILLSDKIDYLHALRHAQQLPPPPPLPPVLPAIEMPAIPNIANKTPLWKYALWSFAIIGVGYLIYYFNKSKPEDEKINTIK